jgi:LPXTG-site transpeptidase (sortase) family protein
MGVPSNIHVAGWYTKSVLPGEKGLSVIDGHVHGTYSAGIFENLGKLQKDDRILITFGDNSQKTFSVVSTTTLSLEKANELFLKHDPKIPQELHLITCTGEYSEKLKTYNERVLVVATLVE